MTQFGFGDWDSLRETASRLTNAERAKAMDLSAGTVAQIRAKLMVDPLVREYVRRLDTLRAPRNTEGWHAYAERRYVELCVLTAGEPGGVVFDYPLAEYGMQVPPQAEAMRLFFRLEFAQCYLWSLSIHDHVRHSPPLPRHVISRELLPYPIMFWSHETAIEGKSDVNLENNWILLTDEGSHINVFADVRSGQRYEISGGNIRYGATWPDDYSDKTPREREGTEYILKSLAFLNSPYIESRSTRIPRALRKQAAKHAKGLPSQQYDPIIRVVVLRNPETSSTTRGESTGEVARKHHWWVTGHYRAQWYPAEKSHKVIWIAPHLAGDRSKPLLQKVYAVTR